MNKPSVNYLTSNHKKRKTAVNGNIDDCLEQTHTSVGDCPAIL